MTTQPARLGVPQLVPTLKHWPRSARERLDARIRAAAAAARAEMPVPPPRVRRQPVTQDDAEFTAAQKLEGYRLYQRWKRGTGPQPTAEQIAWRDAYKRDAYAREKAATEAKRLADRAARKAEKPAEPDRSLLEELLADREFWAYMAAQCAHFGPQGPQAYAEALGVIAAGARRLVELVAAEDGAR